MKKLFISILIICLTGFSLSAQHKAFTPSTYRLQNSSYRSAAGIPKANYWQNTADYQVRVTFNPESNSIDGNVIIDYSNKSPDNLNFVWLQLDQNITKKSSRAASGNYSTKILKETKGYILKNVKIKLNGQWTDANYLIDDTRMQIKLPQNLTAKNGVLKISIDYHYLLGAHDPRAGILETKYGNIYEVSYFYPHMCVYDDIRGWNTLPYLGSGEFYLDYGTVDYSVTIPKGFLVVGSGELQNPEETLSQTQQKRLEKAKISDQTVIIRTSEEVIKESKEKSEKQATWHFIMKHTRDVAWAASKAFVWDAARINLPGGKESLAMSVYPVESTGKDSWSRATEYLKNSVEIFSKKWFTYPYPKAVNVAGPVGGMEFPGITFDWWKAKNKNLWILVSHEIGHNWYPMIVGSDERRHAWMDEGFNTFIDIYAQEDFNHGEYAPKRDGEYAPKGGKPADEIIPFLTKPGIPTIMTAADLFKGEDSHPVSYFKTAFGLVLLREIILGHERFDFAFRYYTEKWAYKHPKPNDFFNAIENASGEDLEWFWKGWFFNNYTLDQAVSSVKYIKNDPEKGALITIENKSDLVMPVLMTVIDIKGKSFPIKLPVEIWHTGRIWTLKLDSNTKIRKVILDEQHRLPDINRKNNIWSN